MQIQSIRRHATGLAISLAAALSGGGAHAEAPPVYRVDRLDAFYSATDLNDNGQVIGQRELVFEPGFNYYQGLSWRDGVYTPLLRDGAVEFGSVPLGLNNSGVVVGATSTGANGQAMRWDAAVSSTLPSATPQSSRSANGINDAGQVVGSSTCLCQLSPFGGAYHNVEQATFWSASGQASRLPYLGYPFGSAANAINRDGLIVGWVNDDTGRRAALWTSTTANPVLLASAGIANTDGARDNAVSINRNGLVVGYSKNAQYTSQPRLWFDEYHFDLPLLPGDVGGQAHDINSGGQIVGVSNQSIGSGPRAVLWAADGGAPIDLNSFMSTALRDEGWFFQHAVAINDAGTIVVNAYNPVSDTGSVFLLTAVPEPGGLALMLVGLLVVAGARQRVARRCGDEAAV